MAIARSLILLLLAGAALSFVAFVVTGQAHHKVRGLLILKWTLAAAFGFFAVLAVENLFARP